MNTPLVQNDNLGAQKWKAPAADPLNSEIECLAAAAARKKAHNATASSASGLAPKTKVMPKNIQNIATSTMTSGPTTTNTESSTKTVPPTTAKPLANQNGSRQASVEVDNDNDNSLASYHRAPKKLNCGIIELEDGLEDDSVDEVEPRSIKTKKTAHQSNNKKQLEKGKKDVLEILTDSEAAELEEESAEEELGEIFESVPGDL